jgi:hypothetical protein
MLQIENPNATVGDIAILKSLALLLCLANCSEVQSKAKDCVALAEQRQTDIKKAIAEFEKANPDLKFKDALNNPSIRENKHFLELSLKL